TGEANATFQATPGAAQPAYGVGSCHGTSLDYLSCPDAFALKLSTDGARVLYATFLGGRDVDEGLAIAVNSGGEAYIAGSTASADFPVTPGAFQTRFGGRVTNDELALGDAFVAKLNAAGSRFVFVTYLGGAHADVAFGIALDKDGNAFVTGAT